MQMPTGDINPQTGEPVMEFVWEEVLDPATGEPMEDEDGNVIIAPIPEGDTEIAFTEFDIEMESTNFNDQDEKTQLMIETVLAGPIGQMLAQTNPVGYLRAASLSLRTIKTKYSPELSDIYAQTAQMLAQNPEAQQQAMAMAQGGGTQFNQAGSVSNEMKLPQNTNESF